MTGKDPIDHIVEIKTEIGKLTQAISNAETARQEGKKTQAEILKNMAELAARMNQMPDGEHKEHHDFIRVFVEEQRQRQQVRAAVISKIATGSAWGAMLGLAVLIWQGIKTKLGITA